MNVNVKSAVNLDILRGEMERLVNRTTEKPTYTSTFQQESNTNKFFSSDEEYGAQLDRSLDEKLEEQEKWEDLTEKLDKKSKQMEDKVVRLATSAKVFQMELEKRNATVSNMEQQLRDKKDDAQKQIENLKRERQQQLDLAAQAKTTAKKADESLQEDEYDLEQLEDDFHKASKELQKLEEVVHNLEINLQGNNSLSGNQREYMKAEFQMERDHREKCKVRVEELSRRYEELKKSCKSLRGKKFLFQDEHRRKIARAQILETKIQEMTEFYVEQSENFRKMLEEVKADRDAWEEKTSKLVHEVAPTSEESNKLKVKARLFRWQLEEANTAVKRLQTKIAEWKADQKGKENHEITPVKTLDVNHDAALQKKAEPTKSGVTRVIRTEEPVKATPAKEQPKPLGWQKPVLTTHKPINSSVATTVPPMVKANHPKTGFLSTPRSQNATPSQGEDKNLKTKLEALQQDMQNQKRFQQEHAQKMEQQLVNLASRVETIAAGWSTDKVQTGIMQGDSDMRLLLQQMNQQCMQLSSKLEGLGKELKMRDEQHAMLEKKLDQKESKYHERMESMRNEMQEQLKNQQQVFFDKMNETVHQMQQVASSGSRRGSLGMQDSVVSMASLESLHAFESPHRQVQVRFVDVPEPNDVDGPGLSLFAPMNGNKGLSMASGIMMNSPLYQNMSAAVEKGANTQ